MKITKSADNTLPPRSLTRGRKMRHKQLTMNVLKLAHNTLRRTMSAKPKYDDKPK